MLLSSFVSFFTAFALFFQPEAPSGGGGSAGGGGGGCAGFGLTNLGLLGLMFVVFYFMLIRPQQKRQREHDDMLRSLKRGDKVRTSGGIRGEIAEITEHEVWLVIADRVKINVLRSHVSGLDVPPAKADKKEDAKDSAARDSAKEAKDNKESR